MRKYSDSDFQETKLKNASLDVRASDPSSPILGQFWYNSTLDLVKFKSANRLVSVSDQYWSLKGNSSLNPQVNFIGTLDATNLSFRTNNIERMALTADGQIRLGDSNSPGILGSERFIINDVTGSSSDFSFTVASGGYPSLVFGVSGGTPTARTISPIAGNLGNFVWFAYDGKSWVQAFEQIITLDTISTGSVTSHMTLRSGSSKTPIATYSETGVSLLGVPTAPTQADTTSSTAIATTEFVKRQVKAKIQSPYTLSHFDNGINGTPFTTTTKGSGSSVTSVAGTMQHPGQIQLATGNTSSGYAAISTNLSCFTFSGGAFEFETCINIPTLATTSQNYIISIGTLDTLMSDTKDGVYFEYDLSSSSNWKFCTASNSTRTKTVSTTPVVAATWIKLRIKVDSPGTLATFFINDTQVGTIGTNIPTTSGREVGVAMTITKTKGATSSTFLSDYIFYQFNALDM